MKIRLSMWAGNRTRQLPMFPVPMIYITGCEANCSRILVGTIAKVLTYITVFTSGVAQTALSRYPVTSGRKEKGPKAGKAL